MSQVRSTYAFAPAPWLLAACLSTPPPLASSDVDAPPASPDAEVVPPPDAEPVYQADVAGHGLAWIEIPAGVLP